ncbi:hypothetical protein DXA26_09345 [Bacteroides fragilis]|jgi:hypothetical protein|nr:hypothetical protein DXB33_11290 [Bacteroides fragilis]RGO62712.1 hypothetical protein DXB09_05130 [Bacteroides fragilis]RGY74734.1 hypothetical protein DXA26_09345 [Bacteroides fragilis]
MDGLGAESDEFAFVLSLSRCFCYILSVCFCGATGEKKAPVRGSAHNNICEEAKHIDISPERSKHFPEMLTSFARNVCFFLGKCTVFNPKCPLLWLEKPPFCTEKSAAAFYFILSGRRRSQ